jgi:undecaprenyl diphosphate synthase
VRPLPSTEEGAGGSARPSAEIPFLRNATAEEQALLAQLDPARLPAHLAVIMDGNRRWARERSLPSLMGHRAGVRAFREVVRASSDLGIKVLTAYAFSLENWKRSQKEVGILMRLFEHYSRKDRAEMNANGVCFRIIGKTADLPDRVRAEFEKTSEVTRDNRRLILNLAVNYGSRGEILDAVRDLAAEIAAGKVDPERLEEADFERHLYTSGLPDPDLLIRTSGEIRVSNFLLWQMAYTEFWFTERNWPAFTRLDLLHALLDYQQRERRFGGGGGSDEPAPAERSREEASSPESGDARRVALAADEVKR